MSINLKIRKVFQMISSHRRVTFMATCGALAIIAGCSVGPDYKRPAALKTEPVPDAYTAPATTNNLSDWKVAEPSAHLPRGAWWQIFDNSELNRLEMLAAAENQGLAAAVARLQESRADLGIARADFYPQI